MDLETLVDATVSVAPCLLILTILVLLGNKVYLYTIACISIRALKLGQVVVDRFPNFITRVSIHTLFTPTTLSVYTNHRVHFEHVLTKNKLLILLLRRRVGCPVPGSLLGNQGLLMTRGVSEGTSAIFALDTIPAHRLNTYFPLLVIA